MIEGDICLVTAQSIVAKTRELALDDHKRPWVLRGLART